MIEIKSKPKTCQYCAGEKPMGIIGEEGVGFTNKIYMYIEKGSIRIFNEEYPGVAGNVHINYCPACGRRLERI